MTALLYFSIVAATYLAFGLLIWCWACHWHLPSILHPMGICSPLIWPYIVLTVWWEERQP